VRITLRAAASEDLIEQVRLGAVEVAFLGLPTTARPRGVEARELARDRLVAVVPPDHPLAGEATVTLRRLSSEAFVDLPARTAGRIQSDQAFAAAGLTRDVVFEVTTAYLCVAMLPSAYAPQLTGVTTVEVVDAPARVEYVIWSSEGRTPAAGAFLDLLDLPDQVVE
jgi:DNA-binding transcriptional LysR family regulator